MPALPPTTIFKLLWTSSSDFLDELRVVDRVASFLYRDLSDDRFSKAARTGSLLTIVIRLADRGRDFRVHVKVIERHEHSVRLEFLPEEQGRQELVLACAEGESVPYLRRRVPRVPCNIEARVRLDSGDVERVVATDIGEGGAHLTLEAAVEVDATITLHLQLPSRRKPLEVRARVASVIAAGPQKGVGVEFYFDSSSQKDELAKHIATLASEET